MKKIIILLLLFPMTAWALTPESIIQSKKYYYEVRCTCGMLFDVKETSDPAMNGMISHTICVDCFKKSYEGTGYIPKSALIEKMERLTRIAKLKWGAV